MAFSISIRRYCEKDRGHCRDLWRELTEWHREIYHDPTIGGEHPEDHFDEHLREVGPGQLWVAIHNSEVIGLIGLILEEKEAEIEPVIVSKAYRYKGVGKQLMETVISEARHRGACFVKVRPVARNVEAVKFFYQQGFTNLGHIDLFIDIRNFKRRPWKKGPEIFGCKFSF